LRHEEGQALATAEQRTSELCEKLTKTQGALDEHRSACKRVEMEFEATIQDERRSKALLESTERRVEEAHQARIRHRQELEQRLTELQQQQEQEIIDFKKTKDVEVSCINSLVSVIQCFCCHAR